MRTISGVAASKGIAIGKLCIRQNPAEMKNMPPAADANIEIQRLYAARTAAERKIKKPHSSRSYDSRVGRLYDRPAFLSVFF